jgi:hypothetical protein
MSAANHGRQRRARESGYCADVDAHELIDDPGLDVGEAPVSAESGVVYEERKPIVRDLQLELGQCIGISEVGRERLGFGSGLAQFFGQRLEPVSPPCNED